MQIYTFNKSIAKYTYYLVIPFLKVYFKGINI